MVFNFEVNVVPDSKVNSKNRDASVFQIFEFHLGDEFVIAVPTGGGCKRTSNIRSAFPAIHFEA